MKLAIYDFDGTLFPDETVPFIVKQFPKLGYSRIRQGKIFIQMMVLFTKYKMKLDKSMTKEVFRGKATHVVLSILDGMSETEMKDFFKRLSDVVYETLDREVVHTLKEHQKDGYHTLLLSGGFKPLMEPLAKRLGMDAVICTEVKGVQTKEASRGIRYYPDKIITGTNKIEALEKQYDQNTVKWNVSYAYADSVYDQGVLRKVGNPVGVNPDSGLMEICKTENWKIMMTESGEALYNRTISSK